MLAFLPLLAQDSRIETFVVEGVRREALVFPGKGPAPHPLVLAFHGHGGGMRQAARSFGIHELWPEATVVYPQGLPTKGMTDPQGTRAGWQQNAGEAGDRDLKLTDAILASVKDADPRRTFAMGHSNGGRFTYVLWATRPERFAAYGPSSAPAVRMANGLRPASAFLNMGEADRIVPYGSQRATLERIARLDGADLAKGTKNGYTTLALGRAGLELGAYVHPGGHEFPRPAAEAMVAFFKRR